MKMRWMAIAILAASPAMLLAASGTFDKTLQVSGPVMLDLNTGSGFIHVLPGSDNEVHIVGYVHANGWGSGSAEDRVKEVVDHPPIEQSGNEISVGRHTNYHNISIDYDVKVPRGSSVSAGSGSGDVRLAELGGTVKGNTGSGSITAAGLSGQVTLGTGSGDIEADFRSASNVKATTGSGSIKLRGVTSGLFARSGSGDLEVDGQPGGDWKLESGSGSVTLNTGNAPFTLEASTGSGSVHSDPTIATHGDIDHHHVEGEVNGGGPAVRVVTGSGDIRIH